MAKRVFMIVLDSAGIGEMPDSKDFGDEGVNTLRSCSEDEHFSLPNAQSYGLFDIDGLSFMKDINIPDSFDLKKAAVKPSFYGKFAELSRGKDTTIGHWEMAGLVSPEPLPTFPNGFPKELLDEFSARTGRKVLCNLPYSGTDVIRDYGKEHVETGALIVYTSADSVFQIAAHEEVVPIEELYRYCEIARELCQGKYGVGRIIARPFEGEWPYKRTSGRHDYSLVPPRKTILNYISEYGKDVLAVGKINDIFAGSGVTKMVRTVNNADGIEKTLEWMDLDFDGFCFTNLVDTDMIYGHRRDVAGYASALSYFDSKLPELVAKLRKDDILLITADHGCDPKAHGTDHTREYVGVVGIGDCIKAGTNLGTRTTFADTGATILDYLGVPGKIDGTSYLSTILGK